jgi:carboxyl-terminal processing protease
LRDSALSSTFATKSPSELPKYKTDHGRTVMGGGGIQPDLVVYPQALTGLENVLEASGSFTSFATQFLSTHTPLPENFTVTAEVLDEFKVYLSGRRIQPSVAEWSSDRTWISNRLLESVVTQARGVDKGDEVAARQDTEIQAALKAIEEGSILRAAR